MPLTDVAVRAAKPREKSYKLADGQGMYIEVMPNGSKYWRLKYRIDSKEERMALGVYPAVTVLAARKARDEIKEQLRGGLDPSHEKKRVKSLLSLDRANSFEPIAREWHEQKKGAWSEQHADRMMKLLERELFSPLGARPITEISTPNCLRSFERSRLATRSSSHIRRSRQQVRSFDTPLPQDALSATRRRISEAR